MRSTIVILVFLLCIILSSIELLTKKNCKLLTIFLLFVSTSLVITRDVNVVPDSQAYVNSYNNILVTSNWYNVENNIYGFEEGFMQFSLIFKKMGFDAMTFLAICFLTMIGILLWSQRCNVKWIRDNNSISECLDCVFIALWLGYFGIMYGTISIRAGLAITLGYSAFFLIKQRKIFLAVLFMLISIRFHVSVIILFLGYVVCLCLNIEKKRTYVIWWLFIVMLWLSRASLYINLLITTVVDFLASHIHSFVKYSLFYAGKTLGDGFFSKKNLFFLFMGLLFIIYKPQNKRYDDLLKIYLLGLTIVFLSNELTVGYRISDMFMLFLIPLTYYLVTENKYFRRNSRICLNVLFISLQFFIGLRISGIV